MNHGALSNSRFNKKRTSAKQLKLLSKWQKHRAIMNHRQPSLNQQGLLRLGSMQLFRILPLMVGRNLLVIAQNVDAFHDQLVAAGLRKALLGLVS